MIVKMIRQDKLRQTVSTIIVQVVEQGVIVWVEDTASYGLNKKRSEIKSYNVLMLCNSV